MDSYKDIQKLQELFDASKSALVIPVVFTFLCVLVEVVEVLPFKLLHTVREHSWFKSATEIFVDGYKLYFVGMVGVAAFAHYVSPAILFYITLVFYVAFYKLPLIHKNEHLKRGIVEAIFLALIGGYFLLTVFEISF